MASRVYQQSVNRARGGLEPRSLAPGVLVRGCTTTQSQESARPRSAARARSGQPQRWRTTIRGSAPRTCTLRCRQRDACGTKLCATPLLCETTTWSSSRSAPCPACPQAGCCWQAHNPGHGGEALADLPSPGRLARKSQKLGHACPHRGGPDAGPH